MNKRNKKGFSLVEMLIVIAVVAILVSIIIPVVGNSKTKAAAATNAANLRQAHGAIQTLRLLEPNQFDWTYPVKTAANEKFTFGTANVEAPDAEAISVPGLNLEAGTAMRVTRNGDDIVCTYRGFTVEMFAKIAETGTIDGVDIGVKNTLMNKAEDMNKRLDTITEGLRENNMLDENTQKLIDSIADGITSITESLINSDEDPDPDALKEEEAGLAILDNMLAPKICSCCKSGTYDGERIYTNIGFVQIPTGWTNCSCGHVKSTHN